MLTSATSKEESSLIHKRLQSMAFGDPNAPDVKLCYVTVRVQDVLAVQTTLNGPSLARKNSQKQELRFYPREAVQSEQARRVL